MTTKKNVVQLTNMQRTMKVVNDQIKKNLKRNPLQMKTMSQKMIITPMKIKMMKNQTLITMTKRVIESLVQSLKILALNFLLKEFKKFLKI